MIGRMYIRKTCIQIPRPVTTMRRSFATKNELVAITPVTRNEMLQSNWTAHMQGNTVYKGSFNERVRQVQSIAFAKH